MIKYIFIVPYRNREQHKLFFITYIKYLLEDYDESTYEIIFAHQNNDLPFNRGGMKNIGFLYAKQKYSYYKDIIFIFNDIDTLPYKKGLINYDVQKNEIKHFYGFTFCLGGIFSIRGEDFERINGFPSFWAWGYEDNVIYDRALAHNIIVNRSQFYKLLDINILHLLDEYSKLTSKKNKTMTLKKEVYDGLNTLHNVSYNWNTETNMLDINHFMCSYSPIDDTLMPNDLPQKKEKLFGNIFKPPTNTNELKKILNPVSPNQQVFNTMFKKMF